jgi:hypothetical protein
VLSSQADFFFSPNGSTLAACSPSAPGPPWLDTANPYPIPYPGVLQPGQYGFYDTPNVSYAITQSYGAVAVTRQISFVVYLMWKPVNVGTAFAVPLFAISWGFDDSANFANGVWTSGGTITPYPVWTTWQTSYPTWAGIANAGNAIGACTAISGQ